MPPLFVPFLMALKIAVRDGEIQDNPGSSVKVPRR